MNTKFFIDDCSESKSMYLGLLSLSSPKLHKSETSTNTSKKTKTSFNFINNISRYYDFPPTIQAASAFDSMS